MSDGGQMVPDAMLDRRSPLGPTYRELAEALAALGREADDSIPQKSRLDLIHERLAMKDVVTPNGVSWYSAYLLDVEWLVEQLQAVQEDHEATTERLRERRDENARLLEQYESLKEHALIFERDNQRLVDERDGLKEQLETLRAERDSLMADTWRAFVESGGDSDGDLQWHCTPAQAGVTLVDAVRQLREDYDEALRESNPAKRPT